VAEIEDSAEKEEIAGKKFEKIPLKGFFHLYLKVENFSKHHPHIGEGSGEPSGSPV